MTATVPTAVLVPIQPAFTDAERLALAGYRGKVPVPSRVCSAAPACRAN